ncbi:MAG: DUF1571 domain-containing protein [Pirellulaceae bacterium]|nr:DUF1571 domain-containing protein [Pirellulaceae bacterium]
MSRMLSRAAAVLLALHYEGRRKREVPSGDKSPHSKISTLVLAVWAALCGLDGTSPQGFAAESSPAASASDSTAPSSTSSVRREKHALQPVLAWAKGAAARIEKEVPDYSAILLKRESLDGVLGDPQRILLKVRHEPFSVYVYCYDPADRRGEEAIYVAGRNDGNLLGHTTGITGALLGTMSLKPDGAIAMDGQRHPLTEIGLLNLCRRIAQVAEKGVNFPHCKVETSHDQKIGDRACRCIQIRNPDDRQQFLFSQLRIYIDDELDLPIRFEGYDWPAEPQGDPPLAEQYTYAKLKLSAGLTDTDFDVRNPRYGYAEGRQQ